MFFGDNHGWWSSQIIYAGWRTLTPHMGNDRITQCDSVHMVRHPRGSHIEYTHCRLRKWPHQETNQSIRRCHPYARKSASEAVLSRMQLTLHATCPTAHGASRLVQATSAWSVKPDVLRTGIVGVRGSMHTTTAMHDMSTPASSPPEKQTETHPRCRSRS